MHIRKLKSKCGDLSIMMIDVDDFKIINDIYGHEAGDKTLKYVAEVIRKICERKIPALESVEMNLNIILPDELDTEDIIRRVYQFGLTAVETIEVRDYLISQGCDVIQGY